MFHILHNSIYSAQLKWTNAERLGADVFFHSAFMYLELHQDLRVAHVGQQWRLHGAVDSLQGLWDCFSIQLELQG